MKSILLLMCLLLVTMLAWADQSTIIETTAKTDASNEASLTVYKYINILEPVKLHAMGKVKKFTFSIAEPCYISTSVGGKEFDFFLIEPGDSIRITASETGEDLFIFTGRGAVKAEYTYKALEKFKGVSLTLPNNLLTRATSYSTYVDSCKKAQLDFLDTYRTQLTPTAYTILQGDAFYQIEMRKTILSANLYLKKPLGWEEAYFKSLANRKNLPVTELFAYSRNYLDFVSQTVQQDYFMLHKNYGGKYSINGKYFLLKALTSGKIQERILARILLAEGPFFAESGLESVADYSKGTYNEIFKKAIAKRFYLLSTLAEGKPAIPLSLTDVTGKTVKLADYPGKIVLLDFWFNGCVGCASLFGAMDKVKKHFENNKNVVFINISVDSDKKRWQSGIVKYQLANDVNLYTEGQGENHPVLSLYGVEGYPAQYLIGATGKFISSNPPRADSDGGKALIELIEENLNR